MRLAVRARIVSLICRYRNKRGIALKHKDVINKRNGHIGIRPTLKKIRKLQKSLPPANVHTSEQYARHLDATVPVFKKISRTLSSARMRKFKFEQEKKELRLFKISPRP